MSDIQGSINSQKSEKKKSKLHNENPNQTTQKPKQTESWCVYWPWVFTKEETKQADWNGPREGRVKPMLNGTTRTPFLRGC